MVASSTTKWRSDVTTKLKTINGRTDANFGPGCSGNGAGDGGVPGTGDSAVGSRGGDIDMAGEPKPWP